MNGFLDYFTSLKLKWNNSGPSLFPKVQKCQFLDSLCFREEVWCISSDPGAFTVVFSAKGKYISVKQKLFYQIRGLMPNLTSFYRKKWSSDSLKRWKCRRKQCHLQFWHLWVVYFPSNLLFVWYLVLLKDSVYFWGLKLTFFPTFDWTGPQN